MEPSVLQHHGRLYNTIPNWTIYDTTRRVPSLVLAILWVWRLRQWPVVPHRLGRRKAKANSSRVGIEDVGPSTNGRGSELLIVTDLVTPDSTQSYRLDYTRETSDQPTRYGILRLFLRLSLCVYGILVSRGRRRQLPASRRQFHAEW